MRKYYIADTLNKVRIGGCHNTLGAAQKRCESLNEKSPGRYQCGDWVDHKDVGVDKPGEWPWRMYIFEGDV